MKLTVQERRSLYYHGITTDGKICANCKHYYQHYSKNGYQLSMGHCAYPRMKQRRDYDTCDHFTEKDGNHED